MSALAPVSAFSVHSEQVVPGLSRIKVRRVAHAVLWGDGLRFRVRDGRLLYLPSTTLDRRLPLGRCLGCNGLLIVRLPCLAWGATANQDISLASDTWASTLGRGFPVTGVHTYTHPHPRTHAHTQVTTRQNQYLGVRPSWIGRGGSVRVHRVCQSPKREAWPHDYVGVFPQHTSGNKHRYR